MASDQQDQGLQAAAGHRSRCGGSRFGITPQMIDDTLYDAFGQRQVSTMFTQLNQYHVVLEVEPQFQQDPQIRSGNIYVRSPAGHGGAANVRSLSIEERTTPLAVNHQGQFPAMTLSFNLRPGAALGDAVKAIRGCGTGDRTSGKHPRQFPGHGCGVSGSLANESWLILAALVTVYIVLGVLYESYIHPITILSTLPSAGVGAILALLICRIDLSVIALIGIILLIGIVQKNAIMMIDFALQAERRTANRPSKPSTRHACCDSARF